MKRYNVDYRAEKKIVKLRNIDEKQLQDFLESLKREEESSLDVREIKKIEEEER